MKQQDDLPRRRPPGRPRENVDGAGDGNPILGIRMSGEMKAEIKARGGSEWARQVLERELGFSPKHEGLSPAGQLRHLQEALAEKQEQAQRRRATCEVWEQLRHEGRAQAYQDCWRAVTDLAQRLEDHERQQERASNP